MSPSKRTPVRGGQENKIKTKTFGEEDLLEGSNSQLPPDDLDHGHGASTSTANIITSISIGTKKYQSRWSDEIIAHFLKLVEYQKEILLARKPESTEQFVHGYSRRREAWLWIALEMGRTHGIKVGPRQCCRRFDYMRKTFIDTTRPIKERVEAHGKLRKTAWPFFTMFQPIMKYMIEQHPAGADDRVKQAVMTIPDSDSENGVESEIQIKEEYDDFFGQLGQLANIYGDYNNEDDEAELADADSIHTYTDDDEEEAEEDEAQDEDEREGEEEIGESQGEESQILELTSDDEKSETIDANPLPPSQHNPNTKAKPKAKRKTKVPVPALDLSMPNLSPAGKVRSWASSNSEGSRSASRYLNVPVANSEPPRQSSGAPVKRPRVVFVGSDSEGSSGSSRTQPRTLKRSTTVTATGSCATVPAAKKRKTGPRSRTRPTEVAEAVDVAINVSLLPSDNNSDNSGMQDGGGQENSGGGTPPANGNQNFNVAFHQLLLNQIYGMRADMRQDLHTLNGTLQQLVTVQADLAASIRSLVNAVKPPRSTNRNREH